MAGIEWIHALSFIGPAPASLIQAVDILVGLKRIVRKSFATFLRRQWRRRRCPWKPIARTAPLHGQLKTMELPCGIIMKYPNMTLHLPLAVSQITHTVAVYMQHKSYHNAITPWKKTQSREQMRKNMYSLRRIAICRWKNVDQPPSIQSHPISIGNRIRTLRAHTHTHTFAHDHMCIRERVQMHHFASTWSQAKRHKYMDIDTNIRVHG